MPAAQPTPDSALPGAPLVFVPPAPAESAILRQLEALLTARGGEVERWLETEFAAAPALPYASVDIRHAGFKIAPVDTNLFPAGFNNLSASARARAADALAGWMKERHPGLRRILLLPENHTRNLGYLDNVATLLDIFAAAGLEVKLGSLMEDLDAPMTLPTLTGREVTLLPTERAGDALRLRDGWEPDLIFLNNDLSAGLPPMLEGLRQPVTPEPVRGWYARRKSGHFVSYSRVAARFAEAFGLDPWLLCPVTEHCGQVNFKERTGLEGVAEAVEKVLQVTRARYAEHGIAEEPYAYIKADSGTYGMGIMTVKSGEEVLEINKKARNKMNVIKEGAVVSEVVVQEGVPSIDRIGEAPAEPVVYLVHGQAIGGAYRVHDGRDAYTNLNATGARFTGMCDPAEQARETDKVSIKACDFEVFGLIGRLAMLAAALEA